MRWTPLFKSIDISLTSKNWWYNPLLVVFFSLSLSVYSACIRPVFIDEDLVMAGTKGCLAYSGIFHFPNEEFYQFTGKLFDQDLILSRRSLSNSSFANKIGDGGNAVFYNWLIYQWASIGGSSFLGLRMFSVMFGLCSLVVLFLFSFRMHGSQKLATAALWLFALHPLFLLHSAQARTYTLAVFLTISACWLLYEASFAKPQLANFGVSRWLGAALAVLVLTLAFLSHYLTLYACLSFGFACLLFLKSVSARFKLVFICSLSVFFLIIYFVYFNEVGNFYLKINGLTHLYRSQNSTEAWAAPASIQNVFSYGLYTLENFLGVYFQLLGLRFREAFILLLLPLLFLYTGFWVVRRAINSDLVLLAVWAFSFLPFLAFFSFYSKTVAVFSAYYALFSLPALCVLLPLLAHKTLSLLSPSLKKLAHVFMIIWGGLLLVSSSAFLFKQQASQTSYAYQKSAQKLLSNIQTTDTLVYPNWDSATMINLLYLHNKPKILQKVDTLQNAKALLLKGDKGRLLTLDLQR